MPDFDGDPGIVIHEFHSGGKVSKRSPSRDSQRGLRRERGACGSDPAAIVAGLRHAMWGGTASELTGTVVALLFIRRNALERNE